MCEHAPSSVPGTLCRVFPENGVQKLVELAVYLEKRVEVAIRVGVVLVARSIVRFFKVFADHVEELDGESEVSDGHGHMLPSNAWKCGVFHYRQSRSHERVPHPVDSSGLECAFA
jgi:hypothetical protein